MTKLLAIAIAAFLGAATPALAETRTEKFRFPVEVAPYQVLQDTNVGVNKPNVDGYITRMSVDVVDENGEQVSIKRLMLHHIVFSAIGRRDNTCDSITGLDNRTKISGNFVERFYAAGEERAVMKLPPGYGYPIKASDPWAMTWMLMNHRARRDSAFVEWTVTYETGVNLTQVLPVWMDVVNCNADPVYDVPGGRPEGSTHTRVHDWTPPYDGRIVAGGGHVHGGGKSLELSQPDCGRSLYTSRPTWGAKDHPFYTVKPVLHEPGPVNMSDFLSAQGQPVNAGQTLRLSSNYDAELPHTRVMGISVVYMTREDVPDGCPPLADDLQDSYGTVEGRRNPPEFTVPITARLAGQGIAREVPRAPGRTFSLRSGSTIFANDFFFNRPNAVVERGSTLRWKFGRECEEDPRDFSGAGNRPGCTLHNVTVASGPRGFSSPNLNDGRTFKKKLTVPGKYKLFCALHPVDMTATVKVRRKKS